MNDDYDDEDVYDAIGDDSFGAADSPEFVPMDGPGLFDELEFELEEPAPALVEPIAVEAPAPEPVVEAAPEPAKPAPTAPKKPAAPAPAPVPDAPLALYRRYRPDSFAEVIGQDHVTVPLRRALSNNKVGHAYLFSGPRGCGKTTSARILARCLNCEQGPTATPCGVCDSCRDLARGGPGSIDVIEIDAASHGGVDDARDLRERAYFAPVASRYKIYIIDEAHMVTPQGFNALLKLVEEPPPHTKFIFATTEPEKVIGTIRSRTHHYPFRLVPPKVLGDYLTSICEDEGVSIDHAAIPLVVRAGAGSVRDSLSVLDQLLGGAADTGVSYDQAAALLGFTPDSLLDEIVDAFAAGDASGVFKTIDKVMEVGQDPRRFGEDLLQRLRDLVILAAVPDAVTSGILDVADDQAQRLQTQVAGMGAGELTRAAEVIATGLTQMRGTTAPRLHLELMCSRVLLPGADTDERGLHARMDRLERRVGMMGDGTAEQQPQEWTDTPAPVPAAPREAPRPVPVQQTQQAPAEAPRVEQAPAPIERPAEQPTAQPVAQQRPVGEAPRQRPANTPPAAQEQAPAPVPAAPEAQPSSAPSKSGQLTAAELRRVWPNVLEEVKRRRRFTHMLIAQNAQVLDVSDGVLTLGFTNPGSKENFGTGGSADVLADSMIEVIGVELRINAVVGDAGAQAEVSAPRQRPAAAPVTAEPAPVAAQREPEPAPEPEPEPEEQQPEPPVSHRPAEPARREPAPAPVQMSDEVSAEDATLDAEHNAEDLLSKTFHAEVIAVRDAD